MKKTMIIRIVLFIVILMSIFVGMISYRYGQRVSWSRSLSDAIRKESVKDVTRLLNT